MTQTTKSAMKHLRGFYPSNTFKVIPDDRFGAVVVCQSGPSKWFMMCTEDELIRVHSSARDNKDEFDRQMRNYRP